MAQTSASAKSFEISCGPQPPLSPRGQNLVRIVRLVVRLRRHTELSRLWTPSPGLTYYMLSVREGAE